MANTLRPMLKATHQGSLDIIKDEKLPVAVLNNRERVISVRGIASALGTKGGGAYWKEKRKNPNTEILPEFISAGYLQEYITDEIKQEVLNETVPYISLAGKEAIGLKAEILPKICDIWVKALNEGKLTQNQQKVAKKAYILLSAFATLGVTALIDEVTGFQKEKDEYRNIIKRYIAKELQPWLKVFGEDYYYQIYRLKGWDWNRFAIDKKNHPWAVANITNRIIYEKLPAGVIDKLKELNPADKKGVRKHRQHQYLSPNEGQIHLLKHLGAVTNIMEQQEGGQWETALHAIDRRFPSKRIGQQPTLELGYHSADKKVFTGLVKQASKPKPLKKEKLA